MNKANWKQLTKINLCKSNIIQTAIHVIGRVANILVPKITDLDVDGPFYQRGDYIVDEGCLYLLKSNWKYIEHFSARR